MKANRVLVADDDAELARMLTIGLRTAGFEAIVAHDAMQALMYARQESPAAVVLDVMMPGGGGMEVLKRLRASRNTKNLPVVVISATADETLPEKVRQLDAEFLAKPIQFDRLLELLHKLDAPAKVETQPETPVPTTENGQCPAGPESHVAPNAPHVNARACSSECARVLVAEDDPTLRRMLEKFLLNWGFEVALATDGTEALKILQSKNAPRLALLDWMMPGMDGPSVCKALRKASADSYTYVVLLTVKGQKQEIVEGLESGADDYLVKPFHPAELKARLRTGLRIVELQQQLMTARDALEVLATRDTLTGLWNRRTILETLEKELARSRREGTPLAMFLMDIDHFKQINDSHGHQAGDAALREVALRIGMAVRCYDAVGRYGGEEFLIVAYDCDAPSALSLAERMRRVVNEKPVRFNDGSRSVTASFGVTVALAGESQSASEMLAQADAALYRAKHSGRDRVELATQVEPTSEEPVRREVPEILQQCY